jgi:Leucine-rich repeat (LRR) protein
MITMSDMTPLATTAASTSKHFQLLKENFSDAFQKAAPERIQALARIQPKIEQWHLDDPAISVANKASWAAQNAVDQALAQTKDARTFAEPLLQARLKEKYGVVDDVKTTYLRFYIAGESLWGLPDPLGSATARTVSLLDAALHNFADHESFIEKDSAYTSEPDKRGQFTIKPIHKQMTIKQFQALCRELDIGKQYTAHLKQTLQPENAEANSSLKEKVIANEKAMFNAAAAMALAKGDITDNAWLVITGMMSGKTGLTLAGKVTEYCDLSLLGTTLSGIVVFGEVIQQQTGLHPIVVYVPQDPDHPMKQYGSWKEFVRELGRQLRENRTSPSTQLSYQQFFSQFVDHRQRGHFFGGLPSRLTTPTWHERDPLDQRPAWRPEPVEQPDLEYVRIPFTEDLSEHLFQSKITKILKDASDIAISTEDADSTARKAWWDNVRKIVGDIFNAALLVLTPFVPGLGEIMMAYTAFQLGSEVIEGVVDLAEGQWADAIDHLVGVLDELAQLAAVAAGFSAGKPLLAKASEFVDGLVAVKLPSGETRLWNPDLAPYEQKNINLHSDAKPAATGLHSHEGKQILRVADKHYEVSKDARSEQHRIQHPERSTAYQPEVRLNGAGSYVIEVEQPRTWDDATLLRRLGPSVADLSDEQLENARKISGTDPGELRRMYVENRQPPVLLTDTLTRLDIDRKLQAFIDQMSSDDPLVYGKADPVTQLQVVTQHGMWPKNASMRIIDGQGMPIWEHTENQAPPGKKLIVQLQEWQLHNGELLKIVMETLDHNGTAVILDQAPGLPAGSLETRTKALRKRIVEVTEQDRTQLFDEDYASREDSSNTLTSLIHVKFPDIAARGIERLLGEATTSETRIMTDEKRIPLRIKRIAQELELESRTARGYEGFYRDSLISADTERLTLNALRIYSDALGDLRIEIRDERFDGNLVSKAGPSDASVVRILVKDENNTYEVRDPANTSLHEATDLYQAVLQALPDAQRRQLGYQASEGERFKQWVMAKTERPAERRTALDPRDPPPPVPTEDLLLLRGPTLSKAPRNVEERITDLYPHFNAREVAAFAKSLADNGDAIVNLGRLEKELDELRTLLRTWSYGHLEDWTPESADFVNAGGKHLADKLLECFERKAEAFGKRSTSLEAGYTLDLSTEFSRYDIERWWKKLPDLNKYVEQISTLNLDNLPIASDATGMLKDFSHLRQLSARKCGLTRLPDGVNNMHFVETLRLSDNRIQLTEADVKSLGKLIFLETLRLDDNHLGVSINVERMRRLKVLSLNNTGYSHWPMGLFDTRRPKAFFLDMRQNPITEIPDVVEGSEQAFIVARTRIDATNLSDTNRTVYENYRKSVGISPKVLYDPVTDQEMSQWPVFEDGMLVSRHPGLGSYRPEAWSDLAKEPDSKGFFTLIAKLRQSADYVDGGEPKLELADRVWRTIDAAYLDPSLRDELFIMTTAPTTCADASAQLFNNMGIKVLALEARATATSKSGLKKAMVSLARGAARLEEVGEIARADVRARSSVGPEEVEIHLAYETGLAERLDLPWQSKDMKFRAIAGVTDETIDQAYDKIVVDEQGNGLIDIMLDQKIWTDFLSETYPGELRENQLTFQDKVAQVEELREAEAEWANAENLSVVEKKALKQRMTDLASQIPVSEDKVFTGAAMTEETYGQLYIELGEREKELGRNLTRTELESAGL